MAQQDAGRGGHLDLEVRTSLGSGHDRTDVACLAATGRHAHDRAEAEHESREVVRADVERRAGADLEQELGVRMPNIRSRLLHDRESGHQAADLASTDLAQHGLEARAEYSVCLLYTS